MKTSLRLLTALVALSLAGLVQAGDHKKQEGSKEKCNCAECAGCKEAKDGKCCCASDAKCEKKDAKECKDQKDCKEQKECKEQKKG